MKKIVILTVVTLFVLCSCRKEHGSVVQKLNLSDTNTGSFAHGRGSRFFHVPIKLLLFKGHAVCTLIHSGVGLMGAHGDLIQRAVVFFPTVIGAGIHQTCDTVIGVILVVHDIISFSVMTLVCPYPSNNMRSIQTGNISMRNWNCHKYAVFL